ncbi:MAG TPA: hypothetical protein VHH73_04180, partial [Verrucomicrobiae bacterium]|nr:hypothetical protein [Verrucomicrobiae bacterium]
MSEANPSRKPRGQRWLARLAQCLALLLLAGCASRSFLFKGPYQAVTPLPAERFVDMHCHTAGIGAGGSGCLLSPALRESYKFDIYLRAFGVTRRELETRGDACVIQRISEQLAGSQHVSKAVILALDGVVNAEGDLDRARSEVYVPNEFVAREVALHTNLLFGASVNPYRKDALARLDWAAAHGAVLVKW